MALDISAGAQSVTFIHSSDLQLGMTRAFISPEARPRYAEARLASIEKLGQLAQETGAEFIVIAGDVFDSNALSRQVTDRAQEAFRHLPVPVFLLPGNHDPLVADSVFYTAATGPAADKLRVFDSTTPVEVRPGVELVGAPYMSKHASHDLVSAALDELNPSEAIRIMVGHGQVQSFAAESEHALIDLARVEAALSAGIIDYLALGDSHSTQAIGDSGAVWFSGSPEPTDFHKLEHNQGEFDSGNALVVTVTKTPGTVPAEVTVVKRAIGEWTFDYLQARLEREEDVDRFLAILDAYPHKTRTAVKYALEGSLTLTAMDKLQRGLDKFEQLFASLRDHERHMDLALEPTDAELAELNLPGYAKPALAELLGTIDQSTTARDAANLLFRLSSRGF